MFLTFCRKVGETRTDKAPRNVILVTRQALDFVFGPIARSIRPDDFALMVRCATSGLVGALGRMLIEFCILITILVPRNKPRRGLFDNALPLPLRWFEAGRAGRR